MSISGQNLSIVIVTLKSEKIIHECIKTIDHNRKKKFVQKFSNNMKNKGKAKITKTNVKITHKRRKQQQNNRVCVQNGPLIFENGPLISNIRGQF